MSNGRQRQHRSRSTGDRMDKLVFRSDAVRHPHKDNKPSNGGRKDDRRRDDYEYDDNRRY